jgi:hypothetical protein
MQTTQTTSQLPSAEGPVPPTSLQGACSRSDWSLATGAGPTFWLILLPLPNVDAGSQGQSSEFSTSQASSRTGNQLRHRPSDLQAPSPSRCPWPGFQVVFETLRPEKLSQTHRLAPSNISEVSSLMVGVAALVGSAMHVPDLLHLARDPCPSLSTCFVCLLADLFQREQRDRFQVLCLLS